MKTNAKKWGAVAGSVVLASSALAGVGTAVAVEAADDATAAAVAQEQAGTAAVTGAMAKDQVAGEFAYDQAVVTPTGTIAGMFNKAAAALCTTAPAYAQQCMAACVLHVSGNGASFDATVADMAGEEGAQSMLMGCACSTNAAGGGAIMNANAEGVAIQTVLAMLA